MNDGMMLALFICVVAVGAILLAVLMAGGLGSILHIEVPVPAVPAGQDGQAGQAIGAGWADAQQQYWAHYTLDHMASEVSEVSVANVTGAPSENRTQSEPTQTAEAYPSLADFDKMRDCILNFNTTCN